MWGSSTPSVKELQKMESAKEVMKSDMGDDCLSCRLIGTYYATSATAEF